MITKLTRRSVLSTIAAASMLAGTTATSVAADQMTFTLATAGSETDMRSAAMAKVFASKVAMWVTTEAVQVHGGYGFVKEYHVERLMRDAKITQIYEGTSEIQRIVISRDLIKNS